MPEAVNRVVFIQHVAMLRSLWGVCAAIATCDGLRPPGLSLRLTTRHMFAFLTQAGGYHQDLSVVRVDKWMLLVYCREIARHHWNPLSIVVMVVLY